MCYVFHSSIMTKLRRKKQNKKKKKINPKSNTQLPSWQKKPYSWELYYLSCLSFCPIPGSSQMTEYPLESELKCLLIGLAVSEEWDRDQCPDRIPGPSRERATLLGSLSEPVFGDRSTWLPRPALQHALSSRFYPVSLSSLPISWGQWYLGLSPAMRIKWKKYLLNTLHMVSIKGGSIIILLVAIFWVLCQG